MGLRVLIVDDEVLARSRLRALLAESGFELATPLGEAGTAAQALHMLGSDPPWDVVFLDVRMPGVDGMALAGSLQALSSPPAIVFVTAYAEHALQAFELEAVDYLTKPVRLERLRQALDKVSRWLRQRQADSQGQEHDAGFLLIHERGRTERIPLDEVVYLKAELKYITVRTPTRVYIYEGSLHDLEQRHADLWLRVHRNALVMRKRMRALEKTRDPGGVESWTLRLDGVQEHVPVSRRQLSLVREALAGA